MSLGVNYHSLSRSVARSVHIPRLSTRAGRSSGLLTENLRRSGYGVRCYSVDFNEVLLACTIGPILLAILLQTVANKRLPKEIRAARFTKENRKENLLHLH